MTDPREPLPEVPGYDHLSEIGRGGFSVVYRATQTTTRRLVALKVLETGPGGLRRLEREAFALGSISDIPNIVPVLHVTESTSMQPVLVMTLMNSSLRERMSGPERPSSETILSWLDQVAAALDQVHDRGIFHRDIKPENVLLSGDDTAHLADFGIAALEQQASSTTTAMSFSPPYAAPERLNGGEEEPVAGDIYSLAATFFAVMAGAAPFGTASDGGVHGLVHRVVTAEPVRPVDMPPAVYDVFLFGMAKTPGGRPQSATEFSASLRRAFGTTSADMPAGTGPTEVDSDPAEDAAQTVKRPAQGPGWVEPKLETGRPSAPPADATPSNTSPTRRPSRRLVIVGVVSAAVVMAAAFSVVWSVRSTDATTSDSNSNASAAATERAITSAEPLETTTTTTTPSQAANSFGGAQMLPVEPNEIRFTVAPDDIYWSGIRVENELTQTCRYRVRFTASVAPGTNLAGYGAGIGVSPGAKFDGRNPVGNAYQYDLRDLTISRTPYPYDSPTLLGSSGTDGSEIAFDSGPHVWSLAVDGSTVEGTLDSIPLPPLEILEPCGPELVIRGWNAAVQVRDLAITPLDGQ